MHRLISISIFIAISATITACGGGGGGSNSRANEVPDYSVSINPSAANVRAEETQQFNATVGAVTNSGVTWSVFGFGNCQGAGCGTITSGGLYTAPAIVPNPATVNIKAQSKDSATNSAVAVVTILPGVTISISPQAANVPVNGTQQFSATVQNTTNTSVTWSVAGAGCTGTSCGTISDAGLYAAPSAVPNPSTVSVTATSQANTKKSGTATVTIGGSSLGKLDGHFAFSLDGFDTNGPMHAAGLFVADGNGRLTNGLFDVSRASAVNTAVGFTGTYTLNADNRGEMVMTSALGTSVYRFALNADSTEARVVEYDETGTRSSGVFISQNQVNFGLSTFTGDYVLSLSGANQSGGRVAAIGSFHADGAGNLTNGQWDLNDGSETPPAMANWTGTYSLNASGRGTAVLNVAGMGTLNFAFYVGYTNHNAISVKPAMFLVSTDALTSSNPLLGGSLLLKAPRTYDNSDLPGNGLAAVFTLAGKVDSGGTTGTLGAFVADGTGQIQRGRFDQNRAGNISGSNGLTGTYSIEPTGRGSATFQLSAQRTIPVVFYLIAPGEAFFMGKPDPDVQLGFMWTMGGGGSPGDPAVFSGDYAAGPFAMPSPDMSVFAGLLHSDGAGNFYGTQDISAPVGNQPDEMISGIYGYTDRGIGTGMLSDGGAIALYMVTVDQHLAISIEPGQEYPMVLVMKR